MMVMSSESGIGVPGELTLDHLTRAGQEQAEGKVPGGRHGAVDDRPGRVIAPHGVHGNAVCDTRGGRFVHRPDTDAGVLRYCSPVTARSYCSSTARTCRPL